jgi:hypothetical protein
MRGPSVVFGRAFTIIDPDLKNPNNSSHWQRVFHTFDLWV